MAFNIVNFSKFSTSIIIIRSVKPYIKIQKNIQISTSQIFNDVPPVKFTTNKAAKVPIAETIGLETKSSSRVWYEKYIVVASIVVFFAYFFVFRKENDIDEILKGNPDFTNPKTELVKLKLQLKYCEGKKLPTAALRDKIEELEEATKSRPSFRM